jgi:hypothetical protein
MMVESLIIYNMICMKRASKKGDKKKVLRHSKLLP